MNKFTTGATEVKVISCIGREAIRKAASLPYRGKPTDGLVGHVLASGHRSILRHSNISISLVGVSQSLLRQLSRHPHLSLTVESTRYCNVVDNANYIPYLNSELSDEYRKDMAEMEELYLKWKQLEKENKLEDIAKLLLPLAKTTSVIVSGNYQAWEEFLKLRLCVRAEREIRELSNLIVAAITSSQDCNIETFGIFDSIDCQAKDRGFCIEKETCGKYPKKGE